MQEGILQEGDKRKRGTGRKTENGRSGRRGMAVRVVAAALSLLLLVNGLTAANRLLCVKSQDGIDQARALYHQPENSIDVVFLGSSHVHCNIDTAYLWTEYGIAAYDYSAAEQPLWMTYYWLREFCKTQKPKLVVLDVYSPAAYEADYQYRWMEENLFGMRFSANKWEMMQASVEKKRLSDYFPAFTVYHQRYTEVNREDWDYLTGRMELQNFKGFHPLFGTVHVDLDGLMAASDATASGVPDAPGPGASDASNPGEERRLSAKSEKYLRKIISYTRKRNIPLALISAPYQKHPAEDAVLRQIEQIAAEEKLPFADFCRESSQIGIDEDRDMNDVSHLNYRGSRKYTAYLAAYLSRYAALPDHRGDRRYRSWDISAEKTEAEAAAAGMGQASDTGAGKAAAEGGLESDL